MASLMLAAFALVLLHNPGNIRCVDGQKWEGQIGCRSGFVQFDTTQHGILAIAKILRTYHTKYGLTTIQGIISRYAPSVENDTAAYIEAISAGLGIDPESEVTNWPKFICLLMRHEMGHSVWSEEQVRQTIRGLLPG